MVVVFVSFLAVLLLCAAHLFSGKLRFLGGTPRSIWLSIAGGISVAYVFVHLLPELAEGQETILETLEEGENFLENHIYLLSLVGLTVFYGLERAATESRRRGPAASGEDSTGTGVFWLHIASFATYNAIIGYLLLHREESGVGNLILFALVMALHFVVNDYGLREHHKAVYHRVGRWVLTAAVLFGWVVGLIAEIPEVAVAGLIALLAGGVILNVLKEELPEERKSRFWAFALGAAAYTALLLAV